MRTIFLLAALFASAAHASEPQAGSIYSVPLEWKNDRAEPQRLSSLSGRPVVLTLVYTYCRATCPVTTQKLKQIGRALEQKKLSADFVLVSLDPDRDTPEALARFREEHKLPRATWHLLTGSLKDTRTLGMLLDFRFSKNAETKEVMHDNKIFLLSPDGQVKAHLGSLGDDVAPIVAGVEALSR